VTRILLGHLGSNGDCLYATTVARQIKRDFPGCHLTWGIATGYRDVIAHNPDVDEVWEIDTPTVRGMVPAWPAFERAALARGDRGDFDQIFFTQIAPNYFRNYDGTIRPSVLRNYGRPITVPVETIIELSSAETERVADWVRRNGLDGYRDVVIIECASRSGQSFLQPALGVAIAEIVGARMKDAAFVISTQEKVNVDNRRIVSGAGLSLRETAALTHSASLFVGCGSGVTVVATSAAAKELPNIQILNRHTSVFASFRHDFEYFGKSTDRFLETTASDLGHLAKAVEMTLREGVGEARRRYARPVPIEFSWYLQLVDQMLVQKQHYLDAACSLMVTAKRYGWRAQLRAFAKYCVAPFLALDPATRNPKRATDVEQFRTVAESGWRR
jgi:hypothetical protein